MGAGLGALLVVAWACGEPGGQGSGCRSTGADVIINAQDNQTYDKPNLTITRGQQVCWQNLGTISHTVTATGATPADSTWTPATFDAQLNPNLVVIRTFGRAGLYAYHCAIHPGMQGSINVP
jgi:plastocyanin